MSESKGERCAFCDMIAGRLPATIVAEDALTVAFLDLRQFHAGHVLVIPRLHVADIRFADDATAAALLVMVARVARSVDALFPSDGLSVWHSAGEGANQEVPHLHFHVHPRRVADEMLRVYPRPPATPERDTLERWGERLRESLSQASSTAELERDVVPSRTRDSKAGGRMDDRLNSLEHFVIRVSSPKPGGEPVAIRGAVYGSGTADIESISGFTPIELDADGPVLVGMVQAVDSKLQVMVDILAAREDADPELLMRARARTVLLGERLTRDSGRFIRGVP